MKRNAPSPQGLEALLDRAGRLLAQLESMLPGLPPPVDWAGGVAWRWRKSGARGQLRLVEHPHRIRLADLRGVERQKALIVDNTRQFIAGRPANNVLLTGARGTGKSSLVKALLNRYRRDGLRLIEVDRQDLIDLPDIVERVEGRPERFIVFCDDLSFEASEPGYKSLKVVLDGSIAAAGDNLLIYATSNRRHLMPEFMRENLEAQRVGDEIHPGESVEEKVSLSERFGLWISFYPFDQDEYLDIVAHWLRAFGVPAREAGDERTREQALQWALLRGSRSGRVAWQFARDRAGRLAGGSPRAAGRSARRAAASGRRTARGRN